MLVQRERLIDELSAPGHLLVWAGPGSGKSTLLAQWVARALQCGIRTVLVDGASPSALRAALAARAAIEVLVVDNAEALTGRERQVLGDLLEVEGTPRLIVAGRWDPFAPSPARWIATRELRTLDLAFTRPEFETLLLARGIRLEPDVTDELHARIAGWAAGAALASHVLADHADADVMARAFAGDHRAIGDYLLGEVLGSLEETEREVLLACAAREPVTPDFAIAASGHADAVAVLDDLARRNLLVEARSDGEVSYHPVLRAYLVAELRRSAPGQRLALSRRICAWCLEQDLPGEALGHALAASDPESLVRTLRARGVELLLRGDARVADAVDAIGPADPALAATLRLLLQAPHLAAMGEGELEGLDESTPALAVVAACLRALWQGRLPTSRRADAAVLPDERAAAYFDGFVRARLAVTSSTDPVDRAIALEGLQRLVALAHDAGYSWLRLVVMESVLTLAMGTPQWRTAEPLLIAAIRHPLAADTLIGEAGSRLLALTARLAYLRARPVPDGVSGVLQSPGFARRHPEAARRVRAIALLDAFGVAPSREALARFDVFAMESAADPDFLSVVMVPWLSAAAHLSNQPMIAAIRFRAEQAFGRALESTLAAFVAGPCRDAEAALRAAIEDGAPSWDPLTLAHAQLRLAVYADQHGAQGRGLAALAEAVKVANHFAAIRPFLLFDGEVIPLLAAGAERLGAWREAALEILARCHEVRGSDAVSSLVQLSPRERALLDELPVHQTIADIARHQQVSPNTVKSQLRSMYRKLGVESRAEAVAAGRNAGLIG